MNPVLKNVGLIVLIVIGAMIMAHFKTLLFRFLRRK